MYSHKNERLQQNYKKEQFNQDKFIIQKQKKIIRQIGFLRVF